MKKKRVNVDKKYQLLLIRNCNSKRVNKYTRAYTQSKTECSKTETVLILLEFSEALLITYIVSERDLHRFKPVIL